MFKKSLSKKIMAFVLAGCMVLPAAGYLGGTNVADWFKATTVEAGGFDTIPVDVATTESDGVYKRTYMSENGIPLQNDPSSAYYTKYRKSMYYMYGDVGGTIGIPTYSGKTYSDAGHEMIRYETDGTRKATLKANATADIGSRENPCVIVEIVPDELASQFSFMVKGQEVYDQVYANLFTNYQSGTTSDFGSLRNDGNITFEKLKIGGTNYNTGVWYSLNSFTKEVLGYGYRNQELAQAPEIDKYFFEGWFVSDSVNPDMFNEANRIDKYVFTGDTTTRDLHVYAKWSYQAYDNDTSDVADDIDLSTKIYMDSSTYDKISDTEQFTISSQPGIAGDGVKATVKNGEWSKADLAFQSITFHYALPTGLVEVDVDSDGKIDKEPENVDSDGDGLIGEYEVIDVAPKAKVSFQYDYDFDNKVIDLVGGDWVNNGVYSNQSLPWYPSLLGNTDFNVLYGNGNVQVVIIPSMEFKTGNQATYETILDNADLVFVADEAYSGGSEYQDITSIAQKIGSNDTARADAYRKMLRTDALHDIEAKAISGTTIKYTTGVKLRDIDVEAYAILRLLKNMAADNSLNHKIAVLTQSNISNASDEALNIKKLVTLASANSDYTVAWETWKDKISIKPATSVSGYGPYIASDNTLVVEDLAGYESVKWMTGCETFWPYDGECKNSTDTWSSTTKSWSEIPGSIGLSPMTGEAGSAFARLITEGWIYNGVLEGDGLHNINYALTNSLMIYNSDNSLVKMFTKTGGFTNSNHWNEDGYDYLRDEGVIKPATGVITTGLALHSLMFSGGGKTDMLVIDNYSETYSDASSGSNVVYVVNEFTGIGSTKLLYHVDTNFGTDYYIEYYKIKPTGSFKNNYASAIVSTNAEKLDLSGPDAADTAGLRTYGRTVGTTELNMADIKGISSFTYTPSGAAAPVTIPETVKLENPGPTPDGRLVGVLLNSTEVDATHSEKYVIVARHNDGHFIAYAYVEVRISNSPFNLD